MPNEKSEPPMKGLQRGSKTDLLQWQDNLICEGLAAAENGLVRPAGEVFQEIAAKHGFTSKRC